MALELEEIIAEFGIHYKDGGQNMKDIARRLMQRSVSELICSDLRVTNDQILHKASSEMTRVLQAYQNAWTPIGTLSFEIEPVILHKWKIDAEFFPDEVEESWLGFLASSDLDRKTWPIVKYWIDSILTRYEQDFEMNEVFKGVRGTITPNVATDAGKTMNGFNKIINDHVTAGKAAPIIDGVVPVDPIEFVGYIETMVDEIPDLFQGQLEPLRMSTTLGKRFVDGMDKKYNLNYARQTDLLSVHNRPVTIATHKNAKGLTIPGLPSQTGSEKIWTTLEGNSVVAKKKQGNSKTMRVENVDRKVKAYTDGLAGVGFWIPGYIFTNDK